MLFKDRLLPTNKPFEAEGHLYQKEGFFGSWKKFYFKLSEHILFKLKNSRRNKWIETFELTDAQIYSVGGKSFSISFPSNKETYIFKAENAEECENWIKILSLSARNEKVVCPSSSKTRLYIEAILDAAIVTDLQGIILEVNSSALKLFGYTDTELIGQNVAITMPDMYAKYHDQYMERYLKSGDKRLLGKPRNLFAKHKSGKAFPMELCLGELEEHNGFLGVIRPLFAKDVSIDEEKRESIYNRFQTKIDNTFQQLSSIIDDELNALKSQSADLQCNIQAMEEEEIRLKHVNDIMQEDIRLLELETQLLEHTYVLDISKECLASEESCSNLIENFSEKQSELLFCKQVIQFKEEFNKISSTKEAHHYLKRESSKIFENYLENKRITISKEQLATIRAYISHPTLNMFDTIVNDILINI
ncbi:hypothetical protein ABK040_001781 [Willaertia magna]